MKRSLAVLCVTLFASCYPPTSNIGESCSRSGDCLMGRCIDLVCKREGAGCSVDSECRGDSSGEKCNFICGCVTNAHCASAHNSTGTAQPYCLSTDGGFSVCSAFMP